MSLSETTFCITGFNGYIGRHLVQYLVLRGLRPMLIGRPDTNLPDVPGAKMARLWSGPAELAEQLSDLENPVILNLAGHFVKDHVPSDLTEIIAGNLTYPAQIFEAMALCGRGRLVNVGTSWEYSDTGASEALNLYAAVKKSNAILLDWYVRRHLLRAINVKLNDTYGGGDGRPKLMPLLKRGALTGEPIQLGYSEQPLNLTYIEDVVEAVLWAGQLTAELQPGTVEDAFVFGTETMTINEIIVLVQQLTDNALNVKFRGTTPKDERLRGIWDNAPRLREWEPKTDLRTGLETYFRVQT